MSIQTRVTELIENINDRIGSHLFDQSFTRKLIAALLVVSVALASYYGLSSKLNTADVHAASTNPRTATSSSDCVNDASTGTLAWTNPGEAANSGLSGATASSGSSTTTQYLKCTNFDFGSVIPSGSTIDGIELTVVRNSSNATITDNAIRLVKSGTIGSTDRKIATPWPSSPWFSTAQVYGSPSDLWGETWSDTDIAASNFGAVVSANIVPSGTGTATVVQIMIEVYYSLPIVTLEQSGYRFYENIDSTDVDTPLSAANTSAALSAANQDFRLRMLSHISQNPLGIDKQFELQYVDPGSGTCAMPSGGTPATWEDVTRVGPIGSVWEKVENATGLSSDSNAQMVNLNGTLFQYANGRLYLSTDGVTWEDGTYFGGTINDPTLLVFDNKVWLLGGSTGGFPSTNTSTVYYTTDGSNLTQATAAADWDPRIYHEAVVFDSKMWIMGGTDAGVSKNDVWYSSDGVNWTEATAGAPWGTRKDFGLTAMDGKLWVAGGWNEAPTYYNDVWSSSDGASWTQVNASADWSGRRGPALVTYDGMLILLGGGINGNGTSGQSDVWTSVDGSTWDLVASSPGWVGRMFHGVTIFDDQIWLSNGSLASGSGWEVWHTIASTLIAFNDNETPAGGSALTTNANDPTHSSDTVVAQTYNESNPAAMSAQVSVGQDGLWDFSLIDNGAPAGTTYCFRMVYNDGTEFDTYTHYPTITTFGGATPTPQMHQRMRSGNWWNSGVRQFLHLD